MIPRWFWWWKRRHAQPAYAPKVLALSPLAYWTLDGDATDSSGNGYDGAATGATFGATGIGDGLTAATADGSGDYIDISAVAAAFNGATGTLMAWAKTSAWGDVTARDIVRISVSNDTHQVFLAKLSAANQLRGARQSGSGGGNLRAITSTALNGTTNWFSMVLTWDTTADEVKLYLNGTQVGTTLTGLTTFVGTPDATRCTIGAAATDGTICWNGAIAHVALWDRALTSTEVASIGTL